MHSVAILLIIFNLLTKCLFFVRKPSLYLTDMAYKSSRFALAAITLVFLASSACKKRGPDPLPVQEPMRYEYFPLRKGNYRIYQLDTFFYNGNSHNIADSTRYQIREVITDSLKDQTGQILYRIQRYIRRSGGEPWTEWDIYAAQHTAAGAEVLLNNKRYIKLNLPMSANKTWNPDQYNKTDELEASKRQGRYLRLHQPWTHGMLHFDSTVTIELQNEVNMVDRWLEEEQYAYRVGLIRHTRDSLNIQEVGTRGIQVRQVLLEYGR